MIVENKQLGETPLHVIERLKKQDLALQEKPMTYAGRLDPLATGALLILVGDEVHKKDDYLALNKTYQATFMLGFETDTYDVLGIAQHVSNKKIDKEKIENTLEQYKGEITLPFPPYSSYKIQGKPLHQWARNNKLDEITIPKQTTMVHEIAMTDYQVITVNTLRTDVQKIVNAVEGDFRQDKIVTSWKQELAKAKDLIQITMRLHVSSGTYVRAIVHDIGKQLKTGAVLTQLHRSSIGEFSV